jgi:hypothetical protein
MTTPVAILDANVLYSASLRHLLIWLAVAEAFDARWTEVIQDEWTRSLLRDDPSVDARRIVRTRRLMDTHIPDALVTGYEPLISGLTLPDPNDRHVLAAAIRCGATIIVTKNLKDFPAAPLAAHGIAAMHPDMFVRSLLDTNPDAVIDGARSHRSQLVNPPRSAAEYIAALEAQGMTATAAALRQSAHLL